MSESAARAQRAAALEEKRKRLEELKARRSQRGADSAAVSAKVSSSANLDEYIDDLLRQPGAANTPVAATTTQAEAPALVNETGETPTKAPAQVATANNVIAQAAPPAAPPVKKVETFTVCTQTEPEDFPEQPEPEQDAVSVDDDKPLDDDDEVAPGESAKDEEGEDPKVLSPEELEAEIVSKPFSEFLNTASKKVERVLGTPQLADLLVDYVGEMDGIKRSESKVSDGSVFLASRQLYQCPKWTANRDVTDLHWSPLHRELMLSTYDMPMSANTANQLSKGSAAVSAVSHTDTSSSSLTPRSGELQSDGLALVWSLAMPGRPEHIFTCGSPVLTGRFHPTEAPLVIGGCQSGQLVVWDIRAGRLPVQRSSLTTASGNKGHAHPICSMEIIEGGSGLVTTAVDGKVNFWSIANLRDPAESLQVGDSASCCAVAPESESLLIGDGNGGLHTIQSASSTQGQRTARRTVRKLDVTSSTPGGAAAGGDDGDAAASPGHFGMITSVSAKSIPTGATSRAAGLSKGFLRGSGGLVLTAGVDWSTKLWAPAYSDQPLMSWVSNSYDYMSDVQWSPIHPSLFATASSTGSIGLWNIASSLEEPITGVDGIVVETEAATTGKRGLNKLKWSADGRRIMAAAGDHVHVLSLAEDVVRQKGDEDSRVMSHLVSRGLLERE
ncbi:dynein 1 intermediate chain [Seminavis robusta]|uniref:Dynein 1 intermediate chain n=1 Tax=Seminavis robusta TaxID=568900 RepID=A0A9N8DG85_9STRA|nr:dynein 1 intermediate chain [Seminavis robusta]|eukprot:Sro142_g066430.1 dynein 1 intermediate chain (670) ;mRNA; f:101580-103788